MDPASIENVAPAAAAAPADGGKTLQRLALVLLLGAAAGLLATLLAWPHGASQFWRSALLHAFEGALVGGLCDWFAVNKTYGAIETKSREVADGIGDWVSKELLSHHVLRKNLQAILSSPEVKEQAYAALDRWVGSEAEIRRDLHVLWDRIQPTVVDYVVRYQLSPSDLGATAGVLEDERVVAAVGHCLGRALEDLGGSAELEQAIQAGLDEQGVIVKFVVGRLDIPAAVKGLGIRIRTDPVGATSSGEMGPAVAAVARRGAGAYVTAWNDMRDTQRREAVAALIEHLAAPVIAAVSQLPVRLRDDLRRLDRLGDHPRLREAVGWVEARVDERVSGQVGRMIADKLKAQSPRELRQLMEQYTNRYLQLIRLNGTALGFGIGLVLGAAMARFG